MRISELAKKADVSVRTIRYYIEEGLLPQPDLKGPQTEYGSEYLVRLRLIQELKKAFLPLSEIRERIDQLSEDEIWRLLQEAAEKDELDVRVMSSRMIDPETLSRPMFQEPPGATYRAEPSNLTKRESDPPGEESAADEANTAKEYIQKILQDRVERPEHRQPTRRPTYPRPTPAETWERYELAEGIELNVRGPLDSRRATHLHRLILLIRDELRRW